MTDPIATQPVQSSNISHVGYDFPSATLAVVFKKDGKIWHYGPIPRPLFTRFLRSVSKGAFFAQFIRDVPAVGSLLWCSCGEFTETGGHTPDCVAMIRQEADGSSPTN